MNPEIKAKWLEALRSGKYQQIRGRLRSINGDAYCCLGLLCEITGGMPDEDWEKNSQSISLPVLCDSGLYVSKDDYLCAARILSSRNDSGFSFEQIADWIEANL